MKEKKSFLSDLQAKLRKIHFSVGNDADKDWFFVCVVCFIIFILILVWSAYVFFSVPEVLPGTLESADVPTALINKKALSELLQKYDDKKNAFDRAVGEKPSVVDPSR